MSDQTTQTIVNATSSNALISGDFTPGTPLLVELNDWATNYGLSLIWIDAAAADLDEIRDAAMLMREGILCIRNLASAPVDIHSELMGRMFDRAMAWKIAARRAPANGHGFRKEELMVVLDTPAVIEFSGPFEGVVVPLYHHIPSP